MANFQTRFDAAATEARRLVVSNGSAIREILPGLYGSDFERLTQSLSKLLEKVDKSNVDHPEWLAHSSGNIAEYAVQLISGVPGSIESGAAHFAQTTLPGMLLCEERLLKAVGNYFFQVKEVKDRQVREIQKLSVDSVGYRENARLSMVESDKFKESARSTNVEIMDLKSGAETALLKISEIRNAVQKLASGDARGKSAIMSLTTQVRCARRFGTGRRF